MLILFLQPIVVKSAYNKWYYLSKFTFLILSHRPFVGERLIRRHELKSFQHESWNAYITRSKNMERIQKFINRSRDLDHVPLWPYLWNFRDPFCVGGVVLFFLMLNVAVVVVVVVSMLVSAFELHVIYSTIKRCQHYAICKTTRVSENWLLLAVQFCVPCMCFQLK